MKQQAQTLPEYDWTAPYPIDISYYRDGFRAFQQKFVMRRNYILMAFFAVLLVSFVISAVQTPDNRMQYFLMVVCLAGIFLLWYNPRKQRRMILDAVHALEGEQYTSMCDGKVLRIRTLVPEGSQEEIPETRVVLETAWVRDMEFFYLVCDGKRMFYIVPKEATAAASHE